MNYDSHYLSTCKQLSFKIGDVVDIGKIETNDEPFDIEQPCSEDDSISIKKLDIINDGSTYLYLVRPDCSDYKTHIVLKKVGNKYEKLFELECFDLDLDFKLIDNSVITAIYKISYNYDKPIKKVFKYNLKK